MRTLKLKELNYEIFQEGEFYGIRKFDGNIIVAPEYTEIEDEVSLPYLIIIAYIGYEKIRIFLD